MKMRCRGFIRGLWRKRWLRKDEEAAIRDYFDTLDGERHVAPRSPLAQRFDKDRVYDRIRQDIDRHQVERSDNEGKRFYKWPIAAAVILLVFFSTILYHNLAQQDAAGEQLAMVQVNTAKGQVKKVTLRDGSLVWLNADSRLTYPKTFSGDAREIALSGEAYLEVEHAKDSPFMVKSNGIITKVLGTSFHVKAYDDEDNVSVGLLRGKISVSTLGKGAQDLSEVLRPGEMAIFDKQGTSLTKRVNDQIEAGIAWRDGKLIFNNTPLPEMMRTLQRKYNVNIHFDQSLSQRMLYADFDNLPIHSVLKIMAVMLSCDVVATDGAYFLKAR